MKTRFDLMGSVMIKSVAAMAASMWLCTASAPACTSVCLLDGDTQLFGQNYDWDFGSGRVIVNTRGLKKSAFQQPTPLTWTSKHGSVTFNQYGLDFPISGMNDRGLVITTLWLVDTHYATPDARPSVNLLQWIQYQLDTSESVAEVVATLETVRIAPYAPGIGLHYMVSDASGNAAAIEVLDGKPVVHTGAALESAVLTNHTYDESLAFLKQRQGFGGEEAINPAGSDSLTRFAKASARAKGFKASSPEASRLYAFDSLEAAKQPTRTQWSIVYDQKAKTILWRTRDERAIRTLELGALDFACSMPRQSMNIQSTMTTNGFKPLTAEVNAALVQESFASTTQGGLNRAPAQMSQAVASYPFGQTCEEK